ncbi:MULTISPECIES: hypothetical protein [unclassified Deinococcus]|uniref:hypothetical protein n=1 Tax=unclassified Deinococcus TaxID=2623546 RepID=UPI00117D4444|nr:MULTISPECIES: hypothetical protein [unclassified Deinococcus]MBX8466263.1 hypothetical protein [Deinococcus sp. RIT780]NTX99159.1 hypothetical protein [Deinococcus sp. JMULE3]
MTDNRRYANPNGAPPATPQELELYRDLLQEALRMFYDCDRDRELVRRRLGERMLVGQVRQYLTECFGHLVPRPDVDGEYNANGAEDKHLRGVTDTHISDEIRNELSRFPGNFNFGGPTAQRAALSGVSPDLIVHRRNENDHNLLIVEAKRASQMRAPDVLLDIAKLIQFTTRNPADPALRYAYQLGVFVVFDLDRAYTLAFHDGALRLDLSNWVP